MWNMKRGRNILAVVVAAAALLGSGLSAAEPPAPAAVCLTPAWGNLIICV
jgi:hypothetical protein